MRKLRCAVMQTLTYKQLFSIKVKIHFHWDRSCVPTTQSTADASSNETGLANTQTLAARIGKTSFAKSMPDILSAGGVKDTTVSVKVKISLFPISILTRLEWSMVQSECLDQQTYH